MPHVTIWLSGRFLNDVILRNSQTISFYLNDKSFFSRFEEVF